MTQIEQINFEQAVYDAFGRVTDFTLAMRIARYFYEQADKDTKAELLEWAKEKRAAILNCDATEERKVAALSVCDAFIEKIKPL